MTEIILIVKSGGGKGKIFPSGSNALKEMNEFNTLLYVNDKKIKFENYYYGEKPGICVIKIIFNFIIKDCSYMFNAMFCCNSNFIDFDFSGLK